jgi:hypothetical protein
MTAKNQSALIVNCKFGDMVEALRQVSQDVD